MFIQNKRWRIRNSDEGKLGQKIDKGKLPREAIHISMHFHIFFYDLLMFIYRS